VDHVEVNGGYADVISLLGVGLVVGLTLVLMVAVVDLAVFDVQGLRVGNAVS